MLPYLDQSTVGAVCPPPERLAEDAWLSLSPRHERAIHSERLQQRGHRFACRMYVPYHNRADSPLAVIAKHARSDVAQLEQFVYTQILPKLPIPTLRWFGLSSSDNPLYCWIFMEDAGNLIFDPAVQAHRILAARWLGHMHLATADMNPLTTLPHRGAAQHHVILLHAIAALHANRDYPGLSADEQFTLQMLECQLRLIRSRWDEIEEGCIAAPLVLVHGDFANRNLRVRDIAEAPTLLPLDWEDAAWGTPALDLMHARPKSICEAANPDLPIYCELIHRRWPQFDVAAAKRLGNFGRLFWFVLAVQQELTGLNSDELHRQLRNLRLNRAGLADTMRALGWVETGRQLQC